MRLRVWLRLWIRLQLRVKGTTLNGMEIDFESFGSVSSIGCMACDKASVTALADSLTVGTPIFATWQYRGDTPHISHPTC